MNRVTIRESFVGLLYEDGVFRRLLDPGQHELRPARHLLRRLADWLLAPEDQEPERSVIQVDLRERSLTIKGQEILTADKVAIRVSILVYFRVTDPPAALHRVASYEDRIYEDVQLATRRYLASLSLDPILQDRNGISAAVREDVRESAAGYGVEILRADVKDLIFPGNLRDIMNQVLETERRSEARLIHVRTEAEAQRIQQEADNREALARLATEREQARLRAETEREQARIRAETEAERRAAELAAAQREATALREQPELLELKRLEVLRELGKAPGGKFVIGLPDEDLGAAR
jgi:regulator of protease activity HflC (stomatin/prohibitin superfamily)